tara:strand:+ start:1702 stop:2511 length:810 start_codon:yes stop_codon:yes gene_type:complete
MGWADHAKAELREGRAVEVTPRGNSMVPLVMSGDLCRLRPFEDGELPSKGDIVLVRCRGRDYLHLVKAVDGELFQIGNNRGHINGWVGKNALFGILVRAPKGRTLEMTCRHPPGTPGCTGGNSPEALAAKGRRLVEQYGGDDGSRGGDGPPRSMWPDSQPAPQPRPPVPTTPDCENYQILETEQVGSTLVVRVKYPNCARCSYEGVKVMVFLDTSVDDAIKWTRIDPHFRDPASARRPTEAPGPEARFPASDRGWEDALAYAQRTQGNT